MKLICIPAGHEMTGSGGDRSEVMLYGPRRQSSSFASFGGAPLKEIRRKRLSGNPMAWDLLSIAMAVTAADRSVLRRRSSDGWTRELDLVIAVADPQFWNSQVEHISKMLGFLTTDLWTLEFIGDGFQPERIKKPVEHEHNCVALLSGGLDSLIGVTNLVGDNKRTPYIVSQVAHGDKGNQIDFVKNIGDQFGKEHLSQSHLQLPYSIWCSTKPRELSQRSRSIAFIAYGVLTAASLKQYGPKSPVPLYICENGYISINPPLTGGRIGSLSTRTTHPYLIRMMQNLLDAAEIHVKLTNPYQFKTKGEMLLECKHKTFIEETAPLSTSCGRYASNKREHCGNCVPCLVRRAAFLAADIDDSTIYKSSISRIEKGKPVPSDVRSAAIAILESERRVGRAWAGTSLSSALLGGDVDKYSKVVQRGLKELRVLLESEGMMGDWTRD